MAAFEAHFDQRRHQWIRSEQGLEHQQHQQTSHQVLTEAEHHAEGGLSSRPIPDHPRARQGLAEEQCCEHQ